MSCCLSGGASGTYLESACSASQMLAIVRQLITAHQVYSLDFDVEGSQLGERDAQRHAQ